MSQSKIYEQSGKRFVVSMEYFIRQKATTEQLRELFYSLMDLDKIHTINNCKNVMGVSCKQTSSDIIRIHKEYGIFLLQDDTSVLADSYFVGEYGSSDKKEKLIPLSEIEVKNIAQDVLENCKELDVPFEMEFLKRCNDLQKKKYEEHIKQEKVVSGGADPSINPTTSVSKNKIPTIPPKLKIPIFLTPDGKYIDVDGGIYIPDYITNLDIDIEKEQYKFLQESILKENRYILKSALEKKYGATSITSPAYIKFKNDLLDLHKIEKEISLQQYHRIKYNMLDLNYLLEMQKILELIKQTKNGQIRYDKMHDMGLIVGISEYSRNRKSQYVFLNKKGEFIDENGIDYMPMYETTFRKVYTNKDNYQPFIMYVFDVVDKSQFSILKEGKENQESEEKTEEENALKMANYIESNPYLKYHYHKLNPDGDKDYENQQKICASIGVVAVVAAVLVVGSIEISSVQTAYNNVFYSAPVDIPGADVGLYLDGIISNGTNDVIGAAELVMIETYSELILLCTNPVEVLSQIDVGGNYVWENIIADPFSALSNDATEYYKTFITDADADNLYNTASTDAVNLYNTGSTDAVNLYNTVSTDADNLYNSNEYLQNIGTDIETFEQSMTFEGNLFGFLDLVKDTTMAAITIVFVPVAVGTYDVLTNKDNIDVTGFGDAVSGVETAGSDVYSGVETAGSDVYSGIETAGSDVYSGVETAEPYIKSGLETAGSDINQYAIQPVVGATEALYNDDMAVADALIEAKTDALVYGWDGLKDVGVGTYDAITDKDNIDTNVLGDIVTGAQDVGTDIATGAQDIGTDIATGAQDIGTDIATGAQDVGTDIATGAQYIEQGAVADYNNVMQAFQNNTAMADLNIEFTNVENMFAYVAGINTLSHVSFTKYIEDIINNGASHVVDAVKLLWDIPADLKSTIANADTFLKENHDKMVKDLQFLESNCQQHSKFSGADPTYDCSNWSKDVSLSKITKDIDFLQTYKATFQTKWLAEGVSHGFTEQQIIDGYNAHETNEQTKQMEWLIHNTSPKELRDLGFSDNYGQDHSGHKGFIGWGSQGTDQVTLSDGKTIYLTPAQRYLITEAHSNYTKDTITNSDLQNIVKTCPPDENTNEYAYLMNSDAGYGCLYMPGQKTVVSQMVNCPNATDGSFLSNLDTTDFTQFESYWNETLLAHLPSDFATTVDYFNSLVDDIFASKITQNIEEIVKELAEAVTIMSTYDIANQACLYQISQLKFNSDQNEIKTETTDETKKIMKKAYEIAYKSHILKKGDIFYRANKLLIPRLRSQITEEKQEKSKKNKEIKKLKDELFSMLKKIQTEQQGILSLVIKQKNLIDKEKEKTLNINNNHNDTKIEEKRNELAAIKVQITEIGHEIVKKQIELDKLVDIIKKNKNKKNMETQKQSEIEEGLSQNREIYEEIKDNRDKEIKDIVEVQKLNKNEENNEKAQ